ncbi:glycosyltransferase [Robertmurraya kyonggiensis]|uniref:Glycosyltransferase n=1 Tax=Robertmurraya kyonggiensis TaxID=1037680 RepID=A0A4U1D3Q8_9BACI|nr:glycosyltransferase [Robertmurraya kyonggiensis]TKC16982.1 glycosyltransferase [Robertmurraya kyonggiensis]
MSELISVIMSTYNEELEWVRKSINSILNQTYDKLEFIIILDNPDNKSMKELLLSLQDKDPRIKIVINEKNLGLVKSLNKALKYCEGKYIARMDADDISEKKRLYIQKKVLEKEKLDFVFTSMIIIDEEGKEINETDKTELTYKEVMELLEKRNISNHPTWLVRKEVYENLNGYREIPYCEDYDFSLRALLNGYKIGKVNQSLLRYRIRNNGISKTYSLEQFLNSRGISKLYKTQQLLDEILVSDLMNRTLILATLKEKERFLVADKVYMEGIKALRKRKAFEGTMKIICSFLTGKYYRIKNYDFILYWLKRKF